MCLVSFVPVKNGFVLSSNRDEAPDRAAKELRRDSSLKIGIVFPSDVKGGSWIIHSELGFVYCVLNGAYKKHDFNPPYKMSRGHMLKIATQYPDPVDFFESFDFRNIEPFTLIIKTTFKLFEFRWDGNVKYIRSLDIEKIHIWSSCTLYGEKEIELRRNWFFSKLSDQQPTAEILYNIHSSGGNGDLENGFVMNRNEIVKTVSITQVIKHSLHQEMRHHDLTENHWLIKNLNNLEIKI